MKNLSNMFCTVDALFRQFNEIGGKISNIGQTLRVILCWAELPFDEKKYDIGGEENEDEDDEDDEDDNDSATHGSDHTSNSSGPEDREEVGNGKRKAEAANAGPRPNTKKQRTVRKNRIDDPDVCSTFSLTRKKPD